MTVRRRRRPSSPTYGLQRHQLDRADIAVLDRPDPDHPAATIRGARRISTHDRLRAEGLLSTAQHAAAEEYARLYEEVRLGLTADPTQARTYVHPAHRTGASPAWTAAAERLALGEAAIGQVGAALVRLVVVAGAPPAAAYARLWPNAPEVSEVTARARIVGALAVTLDRLCEAWS